MLACTIFEGIVTQSIWNTIRIGGTNEVIGACWWFDWCFRWWLDRCRSKRKALHLCCRLVKSMLACTIFEGIVTQSIWNTIRIGGTNEVIGACWWMNRCFRWWLDRCKRKAFSIPLRFVVSMVTCAIIEVVVTPTMRETVRVGGADVTIGAEEKCSCFLKL